MRLRKDQIKKLSKVILDFLEGKGLIQAKKDRQILLERINQVITSDLEAEDQLDRDVEVILDQYRQQIQAGHLNERELFLKIKKEMAKKKKIVL